MFRNVAFTTVLWVLVGVPVAAAICALQLLAYVLIAVPRMAEVAAVLGIAHGLWLHLSRGCHRGLKAGDLWFGAISGGILGLLGFLPVFSQTELVIERNVLIAIFIAAAVVAGIAAGITSAAVVVAPVKNFGPTLRLKIGIGCLLVLPLALIEYDLYWAETVDNLPIQEVSRKTLAGLSSGDARGTSWSGCYRYWGHTSFNAGGESGLLKVMQTDGSLRVLAFQFQERIELKGGADRDGRFRFGGESTTGRNTIRYFWEGEFHKNSLEYVRRSTLLTGSGSLYSTRLSGSAKWTECPGSDLPR